MKIIRRYDGLKFELIVDDYFRVTVLCNDSYHSHGYLYKNMYNLYGVECRFSASDSDVYLQVIPSHLVYINDMIKRLISIL